MARVPISAGKADLWARRKTLSGAARICLRVRRVVTFAVTRSAQTLYAATRDELYGGINSDGRVRVTV